MRKTLLAIAATAMLATATAKAETATSRAVAACGKLIGAPYHACLDRIPSCEVVLTRNVGDYWRKGMVFAIDGGSEDPGQLCQHGGTCVPVSAVRFKTACMIVGQTTALGPYYHWERGDGSLVKAVDPPAPSKRHPEITQSQTCAAQWVYLPGGTRVWFTGKIKNTGLFGSAGPMFKDGNRLIWAGDESWLAGTAFIQLEKTCPKIEAAE